MATKIFLKKDSNQSVATLPNWTSAADVFGAAGGNEVVNIHVTSGDLSNFSAGAMNLDQNIEGVYLSQAITAYQFAANGNEVSIKLGGVTVAKVTVQDDTDGTQITYAGSNTPIALTLAAKSGGFDVKLGEQVLTSTPAAYGETVNNTPSGEQAPWTLVMKTTDYNPDILVSNGTGIGTNLTDTNISYSYSYYDRVTALSHDANSFYFTKYDYTSNKNQLWTVTSNNNTPTKLADIDTSSLGSASYTLGNFQLFTHYGNSNSQLLATDGTSAHTFSTSFSGSTTILQVDATNNTIWHSMYTAPYGTELYKTTLSDAGFTTTMVKDIYAGSSSSSPSYSALTADGKLIFRADDGITSNYYNGEAFVSDGTEAGTFSLDVYKGSGYSYPSQFTAFNGKVVMSAYTDDGTNHTGTELVITDGTTAGTKVLDVYAGSSSSEPTILGTIGTNLYFTATDATGLGLFKTDGDTFSKLVSISDSNAQLLGYTANKAYFALTTSANGKELWAADLTASTPTLALTKDILAGSGSGLAGINTYDKSTMPTMIGDKILFNAYTSGTNQALYISDGTEAGTVQLSVTLPTDEAVVGSKIFFANSNGVYAADTSASTVSATQLKAGDFSVPQYSSVDKLQADNDQAFFVDSDKKLFSSNGTNTVQLATNVDKFKVVAEDAIYFIATNSSNVSSLWYSDGTEAGTRYIEDLTLSANSYDLENAVAIHTTPVAAPADTTAPRIYAAQVNGDSLGLSFIDTSALDATNIVLASAFTLSGTDATVSSVAVDAANKKVILTLSQTVKSTDNIKVSYTDPTTGNDTAAIQDAAGNDLASIANYTVRNVTADNVAPVVSSAVIKGNILTLSLTDSSNLDAVNTAVASAFTLSGTTATVSSVAVDATAKTLTLTLSADVLPTDVIKLSYTDPTTGNDTAAIQDAAGNDMASVVNLAVTNNTPQKAPWTLVMGASGGTFISNGTENGSNLTDVYHDWGSATSPAKNLVFWTGYNSVLGNRDLWVLSSGSSTPNLLSNTGDNYDIGDNYFLSNYYNLMIFGSKMLATDGTSAHTFSTSLGGSVLQVDPSTNTIWHTMTTAPYGTELYKTTLSDAGFTTEMVKDIYAGSNGSSPQNAQLTADGKLIFRANDGVTGNWEAFVSDGTEAGTFSLDLYKGSSYSDADQFTAFNGKVVMNARTYDGTTSSGRELVITDGTTAGTKVLDVYAGYDSSSPTILGTVGTNLYFTATDADGKGLFKTDGDTFSKLVSISDSNAEILGYTANKAYFALTTTENGKELWSADLSAETPTLTLTKDILAGSGSGLTGTLNNQMIGDKLLFNAYTSGTNQAYFISDGTEAGTVQLSATLPTDKAVVGSKVFFANSNGVYSADTSVSTLSVAQVKAGDFSVPTNTYPLPDRLQSDSDQAFFVGAEKKFYVSTGTDAIQLASNVDKFKVVAENAIYFIETNSSNVSSLWYSDGTEAGTRYIEDLTLSADSYDLANAVAIHTVGLPTLPANNSVSGAGVD